MSSSKSLELNIFNKSKLKNVHENFYLFIKNIVLCYVLYLKLFY